MDIKPDNKLMTKLWMILFTVAFFLLFAAGIIQTLTILIPGGQPDKVATILWPITCGIVILMFVISIPIMKLWIKNLTFVIGDERITVYKGILSKIEQNIPYRAVTDFRLHRSLYDRYLGIGSIQIQTAGQSINPSGFEANLSGLSNCDELLQKLRTKLKKTHSGSSTTVAVDDSKGAITGSVDNSALILEELRAIRKALESK